MSDDATKPTEAARDAFDAYCVLLAKVYTQRDGKAQPPDPAVSAALSGLAEIAADGCEKDPDAPCGQCSPCHAMRALTNKLETP